MSANRIIALLGVVTLCAAYGVAANPGSGAGQEAAARSNSGPTLGKWEFTGKDNTGLDWTGTLTIEKLDPKSFNVKEYYALCGLEVQSPDPAKGIRGVEAPCSYDPSTRAVSFTTGVSVTHLYTAVLSRDGMSLTGGKWTESKEATVVRSGEWSAKLAAR
jgi:hypothetical protein